MVMYPLRCCKDTAIFRSIQIKMYVLQHNNRLHRRKYAEKHIFFGQYGSCLAKNCHICMQNKQKQI